MSAIQANVNLTKDYMIENYGHCSYLEGYFRYKTLPCTAVERIIDRAIEFGHIEVVKYFFYQLRSSHRKIFHYSCGASENNRLDILKFFIEEHGADDFTFYANHAAINNNVELMKYLIGRCYGDEFFDEALSIAAIHGNFPIVKLLSETFKGLDFRRALVFSCNGNNISSLEFLYNKHMESGDWNEELFSLCLEGILRRSSDENPPKNMLEFILEKQFKTRKEQVTALQFIKLFELKPKCQSYDRNFYQ